jgi:hypothetical protein
MNWKEFWESDAAYQFFTQEEYLRANNINYDPRTKSFGQRQRSKAKYANHINDNLEVTENLGYEPFQAIQWRSPNSEQIEKMMVSEFLFNIYIKYNKLFWCIIDNFQHFKTLYNQKRHYDIFTQLKYYQNFYAGR